MEIARSIDSWKYYRLLYFKWRYELTTAKKFLLTLAMAAITGIAAQVRIPLGFTPVPITGQVFAVLLAGVVLGKWYGGLSQVLYLAIGMAGFRWFAGATGGLPIGPTGGYLIGFIPAALLVGWFTDRYIAARKFLPQVGIMMVAVAIIYLFGTVQFALVMRTGFGDTLAMAVLPFILVDLVKAIAAAGLTTSFLPRAAYNGEVDRNRFTARF